MHASIHIVAQNSTGEGDRLSQGGALRTRLAPEKGDHSMYVALERDLRGELLAIIPHLRAFAVVLTGDRERADDLVQETLTTAWGEFHDLEVGTNLRVWLFKVLRHLFYAECTSRISGPDHSADRLSTMTDTGSREAVESFKAILAIFRSSSARPCCSWSGRTSRMRRRRRSAVARSTRSRAASMQLAGVVRRRIDLTGIGAESSVDPVHERLCRKGLREVGSAACLHGRFACRLAVLAGDEDDRDCGS